MSDTANTSKRFTWLAVSIAVLLLLIVFGIRSLTRTSVPVRTAKASYQDILTTASTNGKVEPLLNFEAHAAASGLMRSVNVQEGQKVSRGTLLVTMDPTTAAARVATATREVIAAQSTASDMQRGGTQEERVNLNGELDRADAALKQAQHDLAALQALQAKGAASAAEVQAAQNRVVSAQSNAQTLHARQTSRYSANDRSRVAAEVAEGNAVLKDARRSLEQMLVRAPFSGTVYSTPVRSYDFVNGGEVIIRMADLEQMQVRAYFDEPEVGKLKVGQPVLIRWDALPNKVWHGHVIRTPAAIINYGTRNVGECLIAVDDAHGDLLPNTNVNVKVTISQKMHVLTIPREGLRTQGNFNFVYRIVKEKLVRTPVTVGNVSMTLVEIRSGLTTDDTIALNATTSADLEPGMSVVSAK